jgi:hypothetical protein
MYSPSPPLHYHRSSKGTVSKRAGRAVNPRSSLLSQSLTGIRGQSLSFP